MSQENAVVRAMLERRSCKAYAPQMPSDQQIDAVVEAGLWAANGRGTQCPVVLRVTNRELRDRLSAMNGQIMGTPEGFDPFYGAPVVLVVLVPADAPTGVYDGSLTMGNMMLAAHALGLGSCWIHRAKEEFESAEGKAILAELGLEGDYVGVGHCVLGFAAKPAAAPKPRREGRVVVAA